MYEPEEVQEAMEAATSAVSYNRDARKRAANSVGMAEPTAKSAPVINEAIAQADIIDSLVMAIDRLTGAITPILSGDLPPSDEESKPSRGESKLYAILENNNRTLVNMTQYVNKLTSRVEL